MNKQFNYLLLMISTNFLIRMCWKAFRLGWNFFSLKILSYKYNPVFKSITCDLSFAALVKHMSIFQWRYRNRNTRTYTIFIMFCLIIYLLMRLQHFTRCIKLDFCTVATIYTRNISFKLKIFRSLVVLPLFFTTINI